MRARFAQVWSILRHTGEAWDRDSIPRQAAALAFYTSFTVAPLLILGLEVAALVFGEESARTHVLGELRDVAGGAAADAIGSLADAARHSHAGPVAAILGIASLLFGASGVFAELQASLNVVWGVRKKARRGILGILRDRFLSFTMIAGMGFLFLVTLIVSAGIELLGSRVRGWDSELVLVKVLHQLVSFLVVTGMMATIFRVLPDATTEWRDLLPGAALSSVLFTLGKFLIGLYLGRTTVQSGYGAAGSFIVVLLWIYYSSQIFLLGAEFTHVLAVERGAGIRPDPGAVRMGKARPKDRTLRKAGA